jgi:acyl-CoA synthetase (AMP-forming)/AMP-acid ligase II
VKHPYSEDLTIGEIPHLHARRPLLCDRTAIVEGDRRLTWREVSERTARLAHALADRGVRRGDTVAVVLQNRVEYPEIVYALAGLGAVVVPVSYRFIAREVVFAATHTEVVAAIVDVDVVDVFAEANRELGLPDDRVLVVGGPQEHGYRDYDEVLATSSTATDDYLVGEEDDVYQLGFTGGTTGYPKACEVTQRVARQNWISLTIEFGVMGRDTMLIGGPFYHGLGFGWGLGQLSLGGTIVMLRTFEARRALEAIDAEKVTYTPMAPTMYTMMLEVEDKERYDVSSVRGLVSAAAPLLTSTKTALLDFFPSAGLFEFYGATEAGFYAVLKPEDQLRKTRSVGQAYHGCELRVLDPDGNDVPTGEVGQIYKRGPKLGARYFKDPEATEAAFRGEWMTSGDLGRLDDEGYLYVVDRAKDMIISGGVNIFPSEIEEVLASHPDVLQCAVIGIPDEKWGETVIAYVVPHEGATLDVASLEELCLTNLARYKKPRRFEVVDSLPHNSSGKLLKTELRARHARELA